MSHGHGGNIRELAEAAGKDEAEILDFSANINPLGPPPWLRPLISRSLDRVVHYPDPDSTELVGAIARRHGISPGRVVAGNGTSQLIFTLCRIVERDRALVPVPAYIDYARAARRSGCDVTELPLRAADSFHPDFERIEDNLHDSDLVFLGRPNNPTGIGFKREALLRLAGRHRGVLFIVDEAFIDFTPDQKGCAGCAPENVVVLRSMTKFYAVPGLRLGYAVASADLARKLRNALPPWSLNVFAQRVGCRVLADVDYAERSVELVQRERGRLMRELQEMQGLTVFPGEANFLLVRIDTEATSARELARRMLDDHGMALRVCDNFGGLDDRFFRIAVRREEENRRLLAALSEEFGGNSISPPSNSRTPSIMFQGTSSSAGKSVMTAALCRILLQDGFQVAPFKAQNMSLNSFVTLDGRELGRAQAMQAQACRLEPDVRMNPVLLKPNSDTGCQVIVNGRPVDNMSVTEYVDYKPEAFRTVKEKFDSLAAGHDVVVLEGAGSPAEINLKHHDIVNMRMAEYADAPVLLVGDIDRGGVFASFVGCMELMEQWERELVGGFVVNKFRGDPSLLDTAFQYVHRHTGKDVLGTIPFMEDLGLPQEDSVEFKSGPLDDRPVSDEAVEVVVLDLPHISNFTDLDALRLEPDVRVRIARPRDDVGRPDAVILPGSKNVMGDLQTLCDSGKAETVAELARTGKTELVGLCGGFQMLGREIGDPHGVESTGRAQKGLGLLPVETSLAPRKTLRRVEGTHLPSQCSVTGYEIHHGRTDSGGARPIIRAEDGRLLGAAAPDAPVWGTYLHGVFDSDRFRRWFIDRLRRRRGLAPKGDVQVEYDLEPALDRLAEVVRRNIDMERIYELL
ncbi:MAG: cobyric acid synthase, partial [Candidatus Brocadiia bacterium]